MTRLGLKLALRLGGLWISACCMSLCYGQAITATVQGVVSDAGGAAVSGASVKVENTATGISRSGQTDSAGRYEFTALNPGAYQITVEASGFSKKVLTGIVLQVSQEARIDIQLEVGQVVNTVMVQASGALLETETSSNGTVIDNKKVVELPLSNRQFYSLALLSPAAYQPAQSSVLGFRGGINVAGAPETTNQFTINGIYDNDIGTGQPSFRPSIEDIQEFKLLTGVYSAEYGRMEGGQVVVATKSGSNQFHGVAYEFIRNQVTDAKPYFTQVGGVNPAFKQNTFGGTIGGPIIKDKTFFFFAYEGQRIRQQITSLATVPTTDMLAGNINVGVPLYNPVTGQQLPSLVPGQFSYNLPQQLPTLWASKAASVGQQIASLGFPAPTYATPAGTIPGNNYNFSETRAETMNEYSGRIDHTISSKNSLFGTYNYFEDPAFEPSNSLCSALVLPKFGCYTNQISQLANITWTHIFNSSWLNETRFGFERLNQPRVSQDDTAIGTAFPGLPGAFTGDTANNLGLPSTSITGYSQFGGATNLPQDRIDDHWQIVDEVTWNHGAHTVKVGADLFAVKNTSLYVTEGRGALIFDVPTLQAINADYDTPTLNFGTTGYEIADLLLGIPATTANSPTAPKAHNRYGSYHLFVLDDWKVTPHLTLNLGLRYELDVPVYDAHGDLSNFNLATGTYLLPGAGSYTHLYHYDYNNFAPRIGFAWQPYGKESTVLKGGYGVFYDQPLLYNNFYTFSTQFPQYNPQTFVPGPSPIGGGITLANPFPSALLPAECTGTQPVADCSTTLSPNGVDPNYRTPYLTEWSLGVQQGLTKNMFFESTYFGSKGTKLPFIIDENQAPPNTLSTSDAQATRPFPDFLSIYYYTTNLNSEYQSWQNKLQQNFSNGVSFLLAYTWGKSIDGGDVIGTYTAASSGSGLPQDSANQRGDRGLSDFDVRHRIVFSPVVQLPFGAGKPYLNSGWGARLAGDWQISGIYTYQTGRPFSVFNSAASNNSGSFANVDRPDVIPGQNPNAHFDAVAGTKTKNPTEWFNIHAFSIAPPGEFGDEGRNTITGPGYDEVDITLARVFSITERVRAQFRAEAFNLANHPNFFNPAAQSNEFPSSSVGQLPATYTGSFGSITQSNNPRELQFSLRISF
jgi:Carboxypeptidase regulatory-like domain